MKKIAIVTDSNSGISAEDAKKYMRYTFFP